MSAAQQKIWDVPLGTFVPLKSAVICKLCGSSLVFKFFSHKKITLFASTCVRTKCNKHNA